LIFTCRLGSGRKSTHIVFLFPSFEVIDKILNLLEKWEVKNTIGRPFVTCEDSNEVGNRILKIFDQDEYVEVIPAHVMTPNGVYGSDNPINYLNEFFGEAIQRLQVFETGLSADPIILSLIVELDDKTLISNSDAHSPALYRLGREFTTIEVNSLKFQSIIKSLRENNVVYTAEFNPTEGKYFLTGHRAGKQDHNTSYCVYSPKYTPKNKRCPICGKPLTIGVLERAMELSKIQGDERDFGFLPRGRKKFIHMVPLIEIIAANLRIKTLSSKTVNKMYLKVVKQFENECELWFNDEKEIEKKLDGVVDESLIRDINTVKQDNFCFEPIGYDGSYGELKIGKSNDIFEINDIYIDEETKKLIAERRKKERGNKKITEFLK
jgi:PHP family Zn ribbon phosphoesterase